MKNSTNIKIKGNLIKSIYTLLSLIDNECRINHICENSYQITDIYITPDDDIQCVLSGYNDIDISDLSICDLSCVLRKLSICVESFNSTHITKINIQKNSK